MRSMLRSATAAVFLSSCLIAIAQDANEPPPSLRNLLITKYKLTKTAYGSNGTQVLEAGPVFTIRKGGLLGVVPQSLGRCPAQYKGGDLQPPGHFCTAGAGPTARFLDPGEKVFIIKFDVNTKKSTIYLDLMECDSCNGVTQVSSYKSAVVFNFPPKFLDNAQPGQIADVIDQVLGPDSGGGQQPAMESQPAMAPQPAQPVAAAPPAQQAPGQVRKGDTPAQVEAAMGQPDTRLNFPPKMVYVYKSLNLKVIFLNGQVSDIQ